MKVFKPLFCHHCLAKFLACSMWLLIIWWISKQINIFCRWESEDQKIRNFLKTWTTTRGLRPDLELQDSSSVWSCAKNDCCPVMNFISSTLAIQGNCSTSNVLVSVDIDYKSKRGLTKEAWIRHPGIQSTKESALLIFIPRSLAKQRTHYRILNNCLLLQRRKAGEC